MYPLLLLVICLIIAIGILISVKIVRMNMQRLILVLAGFFVGALGGLLIGTPFAFLPDPYGKIIPPTVGIVGALSIAIALYLRKDFLTQFLPKFSNPIKKNSVKMSDKTKPLNQILVDTSAIIDGRIADIVKTGFIPGKLLVPRFVLAELQNIADSDDGMRRARGRRGLEVLNMIRQNPAVELDIIEEDPKQIKEVDAKLVYLAKNYRTDILTTDYNLNRVATIETVRVLNINELAQAIRPVVIPGEELMVKVVQLGKEKNQGVGYLEDGTMIVVENGDKLIGKQVATEVTRIFQTVAGKMIFAVEKGKKSSSKTTMKPSRNVAKSAKNAKLK